MKTSEQNHVYFLANPDEKRSLYSSKIDYGKSLKKADVIRRLKELPHIETDNKSLLFTSILAAIQANDFNNLIKYIKEQAADNKLMMSGTIGPVLTKKIIDF